MWRTPYPLTHFEDRLGLRASVIFRLQYVCFPVHLYTGQLPNSSGQLAELIVHIITLDYISIVTKSYCLNIMLTIAMDGPLEHMYFYSES